MSGQGGAGIDPAWYHARERAEQEWDRVWTTLWHAGPRVEELPAPGDVMLHSLGRESLLFVRQPDGGIRGLYNVCRHRASRLLPAADGPCRVGEFRCPFHGWRYALDGSLVEVPYRERFDPALLEDPARAGLRSFRVECWAGWAWFTLDDAAPGLAEYLGPLRERLDAYHMERSRIVDYKTLEFDCNWKTVFDAFNESYHFQALHADILSWGNEDAPITFLGIHSMMVNEYGAPSRLYPEQQRLNPMLEELLRQNGIDPATFDGPPAAVRTAIQAAKRARQHATVFPYASLGDGQLSDAYHFMCFPSAHFNLFPEFHVLMRYRPHPSGDPEKMYFDFIMVAPPEPGEQIEDYEHRVVKGGSEPIAQILDWGRRRHPIVEQVLGEDVALLEHVQRGIRSRGFGGALLGSDESRLAHFHRQVDALAGGRCSVRELCRDAGMPGGRDAS